jgi:hypothetical protein
MCRLFFRMAELTRSVLLPRCATVIRSLADGIHSYHAVVPFVEESPVMKFIARTIAQRKILLRLAKVWIKKAEGYTFIDPSIPGIVLDGRYYRNGPQIDIYLDMLHELVHLKQLDEGMELWDPHLAYVDRPTEIEGYFVAVWEGRRLGMNEDQIKSHLQNPWMTWNDVDRLYLNIKNAYPARLPDHYCRATKHTAK